MRAEGSVRHAEMFEGKWWRWVRLESWFETKMCFGGKGVIFGIIGNVR